MWILKGLKVHLPKGLEEKLKLIVGGKDFAALDSNSHSRNIQFELRIASYFCQAGFDVDLSKKTDVVAVSEKQAFYIECKRVGNINQIKRRLSETKKQLREGMPRKNRGRISYGCIAADVTKVAFSHNGLTFGMTNDHSRDVVQEKLITIANAVQRLPLFRDYRNLIQYWLQIHIPALITYPPATVTRFSSYMIHNERLDRKARRAVKILHQLYDGASKGTRFVSWKVKICPFNINGWFYTFIRCLNSLLDTFCLCIVIFYPSSTVIGTYWL